MTLSLARQTEQDARLARLARLARKIAAAAKNDPACVAMALAIHTALCAAHYDAWVGQHAKQHTVSVRGVKGEEKPTIEGLAFAAMKRADRATPLYPDVRAFASYITIEVKHGRAVYELEQFTERGDGGTVLIPDGAGFQQLGTPHQERPIMGLGADPYADHVP
jgi:hypothetical protein